ncbi:Abi-alpha family protein [Thalassotalea litorea]|uniref:Abi-alpha family protein n=1 Tax=Thalassotalea litorea TaxID=2020715 RepID=UPI0037367468
MGEDLITTAATEFTKKGASKLAETMVEPAGKELGKVGADLIKCLRLITAPIQYGAHWQDRLELHFKNVLKKVPQEKRVVPPSSLVTQVAEQLKHFDEGDQVSELYINLLAKACNKETSSNTHPAFLNIISQLSPDEVFIFDELGKERSKTFSYFSYYPALNNALESAYVHSYTEVVSINGITEKTKKLSSDELNGFINDKSFPAILKLPYPPSILMIVRRFLLLGLIEEDFTSTSELSVTSFTSKDRDTTETERLNQTNYIMTDFGQLFYRVCMRT